MNCQKCKKDFSDKRWRKNVTYKGIDMHHNPPTFMLDSWEGNVIPLCRKHHKDLHAEILKIMNKHSTAWVFNKSEHWTWIKTIPTNRKKCIGEVIKFTKRWVDDTRTITTI